MTPFGCQEHKRSVGVGREWDQVEMKGWRAPRGGADCQLCESMSTGCGQLRYLQGESRLLRAAGCRWVWWKAIATQRRCVGRARQSGGGPVGGRQRPAAAGCGRCVQCGTGAQLAAGAQDSVQMCMGGAGLAAEGGGPLQSEAQRAAAAGAWCAIPGTKASTMREGTAARGRSRRREGGGRRGGRAPGSAHPPRSRAPAAGPRGRRPRSPRPPPIRRPASSRPGSPGNR